MAEQTISHGLDAGRSFEDLFAQIARVSLSDPVRALEPLLGLSWADFARFVHYLFACAGYNVEDVGQQHFPDGPGVDLNLYDADPAPEHLLARVEVRQRRPDLLLDTA